MRPSVTYPYSLFSNDLESVLAHTLSGWDELRKRRVLITGGTGFFGMWLVESFLKANESLGLEAELFVLSRNPKSFLQRAPHLAERPGLRFHVGDVRTFDFPAGHFSHVIHAATEASAKLNENAPA